MGQPICCNITMVQMRWPDALLHRLAGVFAFHCVYRIFSQASNTGLLMQLYFLATRPILN